MAAPTPAARTLSALKEAIPPKEKQFNVMLSQIEYHRLQELATKTGITKARVIRDALSNAYAMQVALIPTCATGMACPFPHVHIQPNSPPALGQQSIAAPTPPAVT